MADETTGSGQAAVDALRAQVETLAHLIVRCSIAAGGVDPDMANAGLTGPQVVLLGTDLAEHLEAKRDHR